MHLESLAMRRFASFPILCLLASAPTLAVEPGVDIAAPRVAISQVNNSFSFSPSALTVEQGDYVRWAHVGTSLMHTTTSGMPCVADGLWTASLPVGAQFTRQFIESPSIRNFFCSPHCGLGMTGQVTVTTPILVQADESAGQIMLSWTGGGGLYRVVRSDVPGFTGVGTLTFQPTGGDGGTSFSDPTEPASGKVLFYLAMNK